MQVVFEFYKKSCICLVDLFGRCLNNLFNYSSLGGSDLIKLLCFNNLIDLGEYGVLAT